MRRLMGVSPVRVIDLGAGDNPDQRATETADQTSGHDHRVDLDERWPFDTKSVDGLIANHCLEHLQSPRHFFREAGRVLRGDGWLELTVPLGHTARADPTHELWYGGGWAWTTPEHYCARQSREWGPETDFRLRYRNLRVWRLGPERILNPVLAVASNHWPEWAIEASHGGELTAGFRRLAR